MIPHLRAADARYLIPLCLADSGWEICIYILQLLAVFSYHRTLKTKQMLAYSTFVSCAFTLAQDICTAMNNWTQNKQLLSLTTEHKLSTTRWVCAHGTGESTLLALLGGLFWNGR
jgi:hypothetical protein